MDILYCATFVVAFFSSSLSGIAGGGGGFVTAPYWLLGWYVAGARSGNWLFHGGRHVDQFGGSASQN